MPKAVVPDAPGTLCARGVALSDIARDFVLTHVMDLTDAGWRILADERRRLRREARAWLAR